VMIAGILILVASVVTTVALQQPREVYEKVFFEHILKFNLKFESGSEFVKRLEIFSNNFDYIEKHNADDAQTYKLGLNQFSHLTFDEFVVHARIGGTKTPSLRRKSGGGAVHVAPSDLSSLATSVDWVASGAVAPVKDQGNCGSCWSFSAIGALESAYYLKYGSLLTFSEQEIVSCDTVDLGCNGGWMDDAFTFVQKNGGVTTEDGYPYTSGATGKTGSCVTSGYTNNANVAPTSFTDVATGSVSALMSAVSQQPVSIAIQANQLAFQFYSSGVLTGRCGNNLDHGVVLVGYGTDSATGLDFWKVRNSWGSTWGEAGYIRIEKSDSDLCGVLDAPSYPNL